MTSIPTQSLTLTLDPSQQAAFDAALAGRNVFVTGPAGTGKSVVAGAIVRALRDRGDDVAVTASTGIAALRVGGRTLHSYLGTRLCSRGAQLRWMIENDSSFSPHFTKPRIRRTDVLVVDEVSMLTGDFLDMTDWWMRRQRGMSAVRDARDVSDTPEQSDIPDTPGSSNRLRDTFGGVQVVFVGDLLQLPPVIKPRDRPHVCREWAFQSLAWRDAGVRRMSLTTNHRQEGDAEFRRHLAHVRMGHLPDATRVYFAARVGADVPDPTRIYPLNVQVDRVNARKLAALPGPMKAYRAKFYGPGRHRKALIRESLVGERVTLKTGARVLLARNDPRAGFVNGDQGVIEGFVGVEDGVRVRLDRDGRTVTARPVQWDRRDALGRTLASMSQVPVKLGWAVTVHKSQGMTLGAVAFDPRDSFERGQVYTALSRVRAVEGLRIEAPLRPGHVFADPVAVGYYAREVGDA